MEDLYEAAARHVPDGATLLDAGCGEGRLLDVLSRNVDYLGVDVSAAAIAAGRLRHAGRAGTRFKEADLARAELGRERFDVVTALDVVGSPALDGARLLAKLRSALRPSGRLLVGGEERGWSIEGMLALLSHVGFGAFRDVTRRASRYLIVVER